MDDTADLTRTVAGAWRRALAAAGLVWLASHVGYLAVTMVSRMGDPGWIGLRSALGTWRQSDTYWYLIIAADGYGPGDDGWSVAERGDERVTAFFPLYPMLIRAADPVLPGGALLVHFLHGGWVA